MEQKEILWLASWYPNDKNPVLGDFIQRHALAVSIYRKITVIYLDQSGWQESSALNKTDFHINRNMTEIRSYFPFQKTGIPVADRIRYNLEYLKHYKKLLKKYVHEKGTPELIHVHVPMKAGKLALWAKRKWGISYILSEQASTYLEEAPDHFDNRSWYYQKKVRQIFKESIAVTNVSATIARLLEKMMHKKVIRVIHNTVNQDLFYYSHRAGKKFRFIHVSAMNEQKNITGLLEAFESLSAIRNDWELRLVGPVSASLRTILLKIKTDIDISCCGEIPYDQVALEMQQASAFVLFSLHENFPCVIAEALCCGLPVVTSDAGGAGDAIDPHNGLMVPVGNKQKLSDALIYVMDHYDTYDRNAISLDAKKRFSYPVIGKQFSDLYSETLEGRY